MNLKKRKIVKKLTLATALLIEIAVEAETMWTQEARKKLKKAYDILEEIELEIYNLKI